MWTAIAATCAPGLIGALLVGANFGKSLAFAMNKPFIPVHHIRGHIAATYLAYPELKPPFLTLIASGGHSEIVMVKSYTEFEILGGTRDDAAGEAFDKVARVLGVGYPGRPEDRQAGAGRRCEDVQAAGFAHQGCAAGFLLLGTQNGGHQSGAQRRAEGRNHRPERSRGFVLRGCRAYASVPRLEMAVKQTHARRVVCAGGVAANSFLRAALQDMAKREHVQLFSRRCSCAAITPP